ncbi:glycine--tRNA ligase [Candidatus Gottesmanbacteria bacterium]|nr:glycine--tRNA ligase [Candidatus Gottesmanbacteria bacterium]
MEKIVALCKRRGFVYPNSEIYGGIAGFYDMGPMGHLLRQNMKKLFWEFMLVDHDHIFPIDGTIITHPKVWEASGHVGSFADTMVESTGGPQGNKRYRADHLIEEMYSSEELSAADETAKKEGVSTLDIYSRLLMGKKAPDGGILGEVKKFSLMVETSLGVVEGDKKSAYLKGEACQTIYLDYQNVLDSMHPKIPFGIAQIGKAFRNEVANPQFMLRLKEFEQWDMQFFVSPKEMDTWFEYWKEERMNWYKGLFNDKENLRFRQHRDDELAHYAKKAFDIEYKTPMGWKEGEGIHWRGDWDLSRHGKFSGHDFTYTMGETGEKFIPWIVETSGGVDRTFLFLLLDAYREEEGRVYLKLHPKLAPYTAAVFPLVRNKPDIVAKAQSVYRRLKGTHRLSCVWDDRGNIGKRYWAQDEIGTPWCVTVDYDTLKDDTVTVRERDTTKQERVHISALGAYLGDKGVL